MIMDILSYNSIKDSSNKLKSILSENNIRLENLKEEISLVQEELSALNKFYLEQTKLFKKPLQILVKGVLFIGVILSLIGVFFISERIFSFTPYQQYVTFDLML